MEESTELKEISAEAIAPQIHVVEEEIRTLLVLASVHRSPLFIEAVNALLMQTHELKAWEEGKHSWQIRAGETV